VEAKSFDKSNYMLGLLDVIPAMIFVVDDDVRLLNFNRTSTQAFGLDKEAVIRRRGGDVFSCIHSHDDPDGCGKGPHCGDCVLRNSVNAAFKKQEISRSYTQLSLQEDNAIRNIDCLITTAPIVYDDAPAVLLVIEDISEIAQLRKLVPMCAWCKNIRDDQQYWDSVDKYIMGQMHVDITHGICPECAKKVLAEIDSLKK
jgi:PAS domain-containing protein